MRNVAFGYCNYMQVFLSRIIFWVEYLNKRNFVKFSLKLKNSLLTIKKFVMILRFVDLLLSLTKLNA